MPATLQAPSPARGIDAGIAIRKKKRSLHLQKKIPLETQDPLLEGPTGVETVSDGELIGRYRDQRLPDDFAEIVRRHSGRLLGYLARCVGDVSMAEDVLQDTFLQVHAKCDLYQDGWPARPWLYSIAAHRAVDAMRRSRRLPSIRLDATITSREPGSLAGNMEGGSARETRAEGTLRTPRTMRGQPAGVVQSGRHLGLLRRSTL